MWSGDSCKWSVLTGLVAAVPSPCADCQKCSREVEQTSTFMKFQHAHCIKAELAVIHWSKVRANSSRYVMVVLPGCLMPCIVFGLFFVFASKSHSFFVHSKGFCCCFQPARMTSSRLTKLSISMRCSSAARQPTTVPSCMRSCKLLSHRQHAHNAHRMIAAVVMEADVVRRLSRVHGGFVFQYVAIYHALGSFSVLAVYLFILSS